MPPSEPNKGDAFLLLTACVEDKDRLTDSNLLRDVLEQLPKSIDMNTIRDPIVVVADNNPGLEGYVPIDASNITISTYTSPARIVACIHSCFDFNTSRVIELLRKYYGLKEIRTRYLREFDLQSLK